MEHYRPGVPAPPAAGGGRPRTHPAAEPAWRTWPAGRGAGHCRAGRPGPEQPLPASGAGPGLVMITSRVRRSGVVGRYYLIGFKSCRSTHPKTDTLGRAKMIPLRDLGVTKPSVQVPPPPKILYNSRGEFHPSIVQARVPAPVQ